MKQIQLKQIVIRKLRKNQKKINKFKVKVFIPKFVSNYFKSLILLF